jgi:hypothetical protein
MTTRSTIKDSIVLAGAAEPSLSADTPARSSSPSSLGSPSASSIGSASPSSLGSPPPSSLGSLPPASLSAASPASLSSDDLGRRLGELAGHERQVQVDFLLHLDEFDRRRAYLEEGYDSLWTYCLKVLHLREGPAGRRIGAMRVLRRFPALEAPLRDGRLCLSTVTMLAPLLTPENVDELVLKAAFLTKAEVEHLVVSIQPRLRRRTGSGDWGDPPRRSGSSASSGCRKASRQGPVRRSAPSDCSA